MLSSGVGEPGHHCLVMTEISRQIDNQDMVILIRDLNGHLKAVIRRAIIHQYYFIVLPYQFIGGFAGALMEFSNVGSRPI